MKKILISLFLIISVIGLSESERETGITAERNETPVTQTETSMRVVLMMEEKQ